MSKSSKRKFASRTSQLRDAMMAAVKPRDIYEITKLQVFLALKGDPLAAREVLDRTVGKAVDVTTLIELEQLEALGSRGELIDVEAEVREMMETVPDKPTPALPFVADSDADIEPGAA